MRADKAMVRQDKIKIVELFVAQKSPRQMGRLDSVERLNLKAAQSSSGGVLPTSKKYSQNFFKKSITAS